MSVYHLLSSHSDTYAQYFPNCSGNYCQKRCSTSALIFVPRNILSSTFGLLYKHCLFILINNGGLCHIRVESQTVPQVLDNYIEDIKIFVELEPLHKLGRSPK